MWSKIQSWHSFLACKSMWCRYILWEAEEQGLLLPYACRMGCCTACAVRIKEGEMYQPQVSPPPSGLLFACLLRSWGCLCYVSSMHQPGPLPSHA